MEEFKNQTIDTTQLPRFEAVAFSKLQASYWIVVLINLAVVIVIAGVGIGLAVGNIDEFYPFRNQIVIGGVILLLLVVFFARLAFLKKGFAFRDHDVLFRSGVIATNTLVIPYNRIQHVALHEGIISRMFGLAKIEIFTAGGNSSDIEIPGVEKTEAENIKQLLMGKIKKEL